MSWAASAFEAKKNQEERQRFKDTLESQRRSQIAGEAPYLWERFKDALKSETDSFNDLVPGAINAGIFFPGLTVLVIRSNKARLRVEFKAFEQVILYEATKNKALLGKGS